MFAHAKAAGLVVVLLVLLVAAHEIGEADAQQLGPYNRVAGSGFPVHPRDMVQLLGSATIPGNSEIVLYSVPTDRWLVVVPKDGMQFGVGTSTAAVVYERFNGSDTKRADVTGGGTNPMLSGPYESDGLGWAFQPGSQIILRSAGSSNSDLSWSLFGYLTTL